MSCPQSSRVPGLALSVHCTPLFTSILPTAMLADINFPQGLSFVQLPVL